MPDEAVGSVSCFFTALREGDSDGARLLWERFFPRLLALARKTLAGLPQRVADADDAVQSAFASFCQRASRGDFGDALDRNDIWKLLGVITVRKSIKQARRERTDKRGGGRVLDEAALAGGLPDTLSLDHLPGAAPAPDFDILAEELLLEIDEDLRIFAILRLLGFMDREIADRLDCTERKVQRKLHLIRLRWQRHWPGDRSVSDPVSP